MPHGTLIVWFRRDLRLDDQAALYHATQDAARIVPLFILDPALLTPPHVGAPRLHFLLESLHVLDVGLRRRGSYLLLRQGDPLEVLQRVLRESDASGVYFNRDYVWPGRRRDARVEQALRAAGFDVHTFADQVLVEPDELLTAGGMPYSVYTPYRRAWLRQAARPPRPSPPERLHTPVLETLPIPTIDSYGLRVDHTLPRAGEDAGLALLARFTEPDDAPIFRYKHDRNAPALDATSHLSPICGMAPSAYAPCCTRRIAPWSGATLSTAAAWMPGSASWPGATSTSNGSGMRREYWSMPLTPRSTIWSSRTIPSISLPGARGAPAFQSLMRQCGS